jgi:predicted RNA-binding protein with PIN domain
MIDSAAAAAAWPALDRRARFAGMIVGMRMLVDGLNVIGSRPDGWWRDRTGAMRRLVAEVDRLAQRDGDEITVVLDGRRRDVGAPAHVDVAFAPGGRNAGDDEIARRVAADPAPGDVVVVTSDAELRRRVEAAGGRVESSGGFRRRLESLE